MDLTAVTALETLRGPLGYGGLLAGLVRADVWNVSAGVGGPALEELAEELVNRTSVFVNPNKHMWRLWIEGSGATERLECGAWVLVWDSEETHGRRALAELRGARFGRVVNWVSRATLWRLTFSGDAAGREKALAREIAVARGRDSGLLANPHIHRWACGGGSVTLSEAIDRLEEDRRLTRGHGSIP